MLLNAFRRRGASQLRAHSNGPFGDPLRAISVLSVEESDEVRYARMFGGIRSAVPEDASASHFPITKLPSELLAEVFYWYILDAWITAQTLDTSPPTPYCWLTLGHVCRAWHDVLSGYPKLSTFITLTQPDCVEMMTLLAGNLPLHVCLPRTAPRDLVEDIQMNAYIVQHILRLASAHINFYIPHFVAYETSYNLQSGVSQLRSLRLTVPPTRSMYDSFEGLIFPNVEFPHLRTLYYNNGELSAITNILLPGLRFLEISRPFRTSVDLLFTALAPLQELEELHLYDIHLDLNLDHNPFDEASLSPDQFIIVLPRLRRLFMRNNMAQQNAVLLRRIVYPATAIVRVHQTLFERETYDAISRVVAFKLEGRGVLGVPPEARSLSLTSRASDIYINLHLSLWADALPLDEIERRSRSADGAFFSFTFSFARSEQDFGMLLNALPLAQIQHAHLAEQIVGIQPLERTPFVAALPNLEELALEYDFFDKGPKPHAHKPPLSGPAGVVLDAAPRGSVFPRLRVLRVHELYHPHFTHKMPYVSELARLACWLTVVANNDKSLDVAVRRSSFDTIYPAESFPKTPAVDVYLHPQQAQLDTLDVVAISVCLPCLCLWYGVDCLVNSVRSVMRRMRRRDLAATD